MGLSSKKEEVDLKGICKEYYDKNILNPTLEGINVNAAFAEVIKRNLVEVDAKLSGISTQTLAAEVVLLRFELFGLAWIHQLGERLAIAQSEFTKSYLHEKGRDDIWANLEFYNTAIARSSKLGRKSTNRFDRANLETVNKMRMELFKKYSTEGYDPTTIARTVNRLFTEDAWKKDTTAGLLMLGLCDHLGFGPNSETWANQEAQFRIRAVIHGLYDGASQAIENIKMVEG